MSRLPVSFTIIISIVALCFGADFCLAGRPPIESRSRDPYMGYVVMDADSGKVLLEDNADVRVYPASMVKLMTLMVVLDEVEAGDLKLDDRVTVTRYAESIGGTEVWLKVGEVFSVEELIYAMMIRSANDAAAALAVHLAGSREMFVSLMNRKAKQLGMNATEFDSPHGLPPTVEGEKPDVSTPRDMAILSRELIRRHKNVLRYTSTLQRDFRPKGPTIHMQTHNDLLTMVKGCDGLKTGYFSKAGFSVSATAERDGRRIIAVVMGCKSSRSRDLKAKELMEQAFLMLPKKVAVVSDIKKKSDSPDKSGLSDSKKSKKKKPRRAVDWKKVRRFFYVTWLVIAGVGILVGIRYLVIRRRDSWKYRW